MTPSELLSDLSDRGITLEAHGDELWFRPREAVTPDLLDLIRDHKPELLELLAVPSRWDQYHDAISRAIANPSTREEIGPLWMTEPDGWDLFERGSPDGPCSPRQPDSQSPGVCDRCGSDQHKDIPIHGGRSIRRDCGRCGRTLGFLKWQPPREARP